MFWGADFLKTAPGAAVEAATWTPVLAAAGQYRLYAHWSAKANRASDAPYTVHHAGGATTIDVNQEVNGGQWVPLGNFELTPGQNHRVVLTNDADEKVVADAVKFVFDGGSRAVVADAVKFERAVSPDFREYVMLEGRPLALIEGGVVAWVHPDHLGTPQLMTDFTGALTWERLARPFGETHSESGPAANPQRFPGQRHDPETGLDYNYFRDYDPSLGRYVESDPIGLRGGVNTYAYVGGNPIEWIDPEGLVKRDPNTTYRKCKRPEWDVCRARCGTKGVLGCQVQATKKVRRIIDNNGNPIQRIHFDETINCECGDDDPLFVCGDTCQTTLIWTGVALIVVCCTLQPELCLIGVGIGAAAQ